MRRFSTAVRICHSVRSPGSRRLQILIRGERERRERNCISTSELEKRFFSSTLPWGGERNLSIFFWDRVCVACLAMSVSAEGESGEFRGRKILQEEISLGHSLRRKRRERSHVYCIVVRIHKRDFRTHSVQTAPIKPGGGHKNDLRSLLL